MLDRSELVHLAVRSGRGPHVTPLAYHRQGGRLWLVAARDSVKVRAVAAHPVVGALVGSARLGAPAVMCAGRARIVDPLTLRGIGPGMLDLPLAVGGYLLRNHRPAATVVLDHPVPTLPIARVLIVVEPTRVALLRDFRVVSAWGDWQRCDLLLRGAPPPGQAPPLEGMPVPLQALLPDPLQPGVIGWQTLSGPMAIPARWGPDQWRLTVSAEALMLAGGASSSACCFTVALGTHRSGPRDGLLLRGAGRARRQGHLAHVSLGVRRVTWWTGTRVHSSTVRSTPKSPVADPSRPPIGPIGPVAGIAGNAALGTMS